MRTPKTRSRMERGTRSTAVGREPVPGSPDGLDRLAAERLVDLLAQPADVDLHDVRVAVELEVPDVREDVGLRDDLPAVAHEELEDGELARRERDLLVATRASVGQRVELEVAGLDRYGLLARASSQERAQAGDEHHEGERLRQEVVRSGVEGLCLVEVAVL